ncbi:MAG: hypothetical protein ACI8R9_002461 [Paraglaciecola sp.]|jgi:hypothetical protein
MSKKSTDVIKFESVMLFNEMILETQDNLITHNLCAHYTIDFLAVIHLNHHEHYRLLDHDEKRS